MREHWEWNSNLQARGYRTCPRRGYDKRNLIAIAYLFAGKLHIALPKQFSGEAERFPKIVSVLDFKVFQGRPSSFPFNRVTALSRYSSRPSFRAFSVRLTG